MDDSKRAPLPPAAYVNFLRVAHQPNEFFLVFGQIAQREGAAAHLVSSLVTSPATAKSMLRALAESVERYERRFGEIRSDLPAPAAEGAAPTGSAGTHQASGKSRRRRASARAKTG